MLFVLIAIYLAGLHLLVSRADRRPRVHYAAALSALMSVPFSLGSYGLYNSQNLVQGKEWQLLQFLALMPLCVALMWLTVEYLELARRSVGRFLVAIMVALSVVSFAEPQLVLDLQRPVVHQASLLGFGAITYYEHQPGILGKGILAMVYLSMTWVTMVALWRSFAHRSKRGRALLWGLVAFGLGGINDTLMLYGWVDSIYFTEYGFFVLFLAMSGMLRRELVHVQRRRNERDQLAVNWWNAKKMEAIGRLTAGISHSLNNALTPVRGFAEHAYELTKQDDPLREDFGDLVEAIEQAGRVIAHLMPKRGFEKVETFSLVKQTRRSMQVLNPLVPEEIELRQDFSAHPCGVRMSLTEFHRVLTNLVLNAVSAMPNGGVLRIAVEVTESLEKVILAVGDSGVGVAEKDWERIFEPYFTTKQASGGSGLGLYAVKEIVERAKGKVSLGRAAIGGACFQVTLPLVPVEQGLSASHARAPAAAFDGLICVVEDEPGVLILLQRLLSGYRLLCATSAEEALARLDEAPAILISDIVLPGMNGWELFRRLARNDSQLKVLFLSGYTANVLPETGQWPVDLRFLNKPFSLVEFTAVLNELIAMRRGEFS